MATIRVVLADDDDLIREGLRLLLALEPDIRVVATAADGPAAVRAVERHRPAVALLDRRLPRLDGLAATRDLTARCPEVAIILLTTFETPEDRAAARAAGARSYLLKGLESEELIRAVRAVAAGELATRPDTGHPQDTDRGAR